MAPSDPESFPPREVGASERIYDSLWCALRRHELRLENGVCSRSGLAAPALF